MQQSLPVPSTTTMHRLHTDGRRRVSISKMSKYRLQMLLCRKHFRAFRIHRRRGVENDIYEFPEGVGGTKGA